MKRLILSTVAIAGTVTSYAFYLCLSEPTTDGMLLSAVIGAIGIMAGINVIEAFRKVDR